MTVRDRICHGSILLSSSNHFVPGYTRRNANAEDRSEDPKLCRGEIQLRTSRLKRVLAVFCIRNIPIIAIGNSLML